MFQSAPASQSITRVSDPSYLSPGAPLPPPISPPADPEWVIWRPAQWWRGCAYGRLPADMISTTAACQGSWTVYLRKLRNYSRVTPLPKTATSRGLSLQASLSPAESLGTVICSVVFECFSVVVGCSLSPDLPLLRVSPSPHSKQQIDVDTYGAFFPRQSPQLDRRGKRQHAQRGHVPFC